MLSEWQSEHRLRWDLQAQSPFRAFQGLIRNWGTEPRLEWPPG